MKILFANLCLLMTLILGLTLATSNGTAEAQSGQRPEIGGVVKVRKPLNITGVDPHKVN